MEKQDLKYSWDTFPKWHDSDTETMKDILAWVVRHKAELREMYKVEHHDARRIIKELLGEK